MVRGQAQVVPVKLEDGRVVGPAEPRGAAGDRVEHGLEVRRRRADDPQDVGGRRLLLEAFREVAVARLQLLEQARVLDRDHRLLGERLQQRDLRVGERAEDRARHPDRPDGAAPEHERDGQVAPRPELARDGAGELGRGLEVGDVHDDPVQHGARRRAVAIRRLRKRACEARDGLGVHVLVRGHVHALTVVAEDHRAPGLAEPQGMASDGVEDRLLVARRRRDQPQDLGGGGLLLPRGIGLRGRHSRRAGGPCLLEGAPPLALSG